MEAKGRGAEKGVDRHLAGKRKEEYHHGSDECTVREWMQYQICFENFRCASSIAAPFLLMAYIHLHVVETDKNKGILVMIFKEEEISIPESTTKYVVEQTGDNSQYNRRKKNCIIYSVSLQQILVQRQLVRR